MALSLSKAHVLLTGASSGIGAAAAPVLAARGASVVITARRKEQLDALLETLPGDGHASIPADLSDPDAAARFVVDAEAATRPFDVVVHNAAIPKRRHVTSLTPAEVSGTMALNYLTPVRMTLATLPGMLERGRGCHLYVSSLGGRLGIGSEAAYCGAKFALAGWAEAMAIDLWDTPVDVRLVLPGAIETEIWDQPGNDPPLYDGPLEPATTVADAIADAVEGDAFEVYSPDMRGIVEWKTRDPGPYLASVADMARNARHNP
ncbi:MAG: SDR family NAD(P)-dependent oxidoreductase [Acidimicrobiales bacterium]